MGRIFCAPIRVPQSCRSSPAEVGRGSRPSLTVLGRFVLNDRNRDRHRRFPAKSGGTESRNHRHLEDIAFAETALPDKGDGAHR